MTGTFIMGLTISYLGYITSERMILTGVSTEDCTVSKDTPIKGDTFSLCYIFQL